MKSRTKPVILLMALLLSVVAGIASLQRKAETGPNAIRDAWVNDHWKEISQIMKDQKTSISFKETNEIEVLSVEYERATTGARALRQLGPPCPVVPVLQVASHAEAKNAMAQPIKPVRVRVNPSAYQADLARGAQVEFD